VSTTIDSGLAALTPYPLTVLPAAVRPVFYTALPVAYLAYLPAATLLHKRDPLVAGSGLGWLSPVVGVLLFAAGLSVWRFELRGYEPIGG
jgi:ABC-2 type transport system permease protein